MVAVVGGLVCDTAWYIKCLEAYYGYFGPIPQQSSARGSPCNHRLRGGKLVRADVPSVRLSRQVVSFEARVSRLETLVVAAEIGPGGASQTPDALERLSQAKTKKSQDIRRPMSKARPRSYDQRSKEEIRSSQHRGLQFYEGNVENVG